MPNGKCCIIVLSLQSALIVAGGHTLLSFTNTVELFKSDTSQWYRTDPLPTACYDITPVAIGDTCYALGGYRSGYLNQALHASIGDLLRNAVPTNQTKHSSGSDTQSAWKTLPNTPMYGPTAAVLAGNLLAVGGRQTLEFKVESSVKKEVYKYSPSTNSWIYISNLPAPRSDVAITALSSCEILVIGGWGEGERVNTVYMGTIAVQFCAL